MSLATEINHKEQSHSVVLDKQKLNGVIKKRKNQIPNILNYLEENKEKTINSFDQKKDTHNYLKDENILHKIASCIAGSGLELKELKECKDWKDLFLDIGYNDILTTDTFNDPFMYAILYLRSGNDEIDKDNWSFPEDIEHRISNKERMIYVLKDKNLKSVKDESKNITNKELNDVANFFAGYGVNPTDLEKDNWVNVYNYYISKYNKRQSTSLDPFFSGLLC